MSQYLYVVSPNPSIKLVESRGASAIDTLRREAESKEKEIDHVWNRAEIDDSVANGLIFSAAYYIS